MADYEARKILLKDEQGRYVIPYTGAVESVNGTAPDGNGNVVVDANPPAITVNATTLAAGSSATVKKTGTDKAPVFTFGIPAGVAGEKGDKGDPGTTTWAEITDKPSLNFLPLAGGTCTGTIYAPAFQVSSDIRLKSDLRGIGDSLKKLSQLAGYTYLFKGQKARQAGVIAQDVEKVLPEAVEINNDGYKTVNYSALVALCIEGIKELTETITSLENKHE